MAQTKGDIRAILDAAGMRPRHRFGQNFMIDRNLVAAVADAGELSAGDFAIEIGPGTGTLTEELLTRVGESGRVLAIEIDRDLASSLRSRYAHDTRFSLIERDALDGKHRLHADLHAAASSGGVLVANLPYHIASPLVVELLIAGSPRLAFTVQREVADRLRANAGDDAYGPLTVVVQNLASVEVLRHLPAAAFWPAPKVESSLVRLRRSDRLGEEAAAFGGFVRAIFSMRRKMLPKALRDAAGWPADPRPTLADLGLNDSARPETLSPGQFLDLFRRRPRV